MHDLVCFSVHLVKTFVIHTLSENDNITYRRELMRITCDVHRVQEYMHTLIPRKFRKAAFDMF